MAVDRGVLEVEGLHQIHVERLGSAGEDWHGVGRVDGQAFELEPDLNASGGHLNRIDEVVDAAGASDGLAVKVLRLLGARRGVGSRRLVVIGVGNGGRRLVDRATLVFVADKVLDAVQLLEGVGGDGVVGWAGHGVLVQVSQGTVAGVSPLGVEGLAELLAVSARARGSTI